MNLVRLQCSTDFSHEDYKNHVAFLVFASFVDIDKFFPVLNKNSKITIFNSLTTFPVASNLKEMKVLDVEITIPSDCEKFTSLKKLVIDDYNANKIFCRWDLFPAIEEFVLYTSVDVSFEFKNLKKLTLANTSKELKFTPQIKSPDLEFLSLSGFCVEFEGYLPRELTLEDCLVINSSGLSGCEKMTLHSVMWKNPSIPSENLSLTKTNYQSDVANLKELEIHSSRFQSNLNQIANLKKLKYVNISEPRHDSLPSTIESIIYDFRSVIHGKIWSDNLREICLKNFDHEKHSLHSIFSSSLESLVISNSRINASEFSLRKKLRTLRISYSEIKGARLEVSSTRTVILECNFLDVCMVVGSDETYAYKTDNLESVIQFENDFFLKDKRDFIVTCNENFYSNSFSRDMDILRAYDFEKWKEFKNVFNYFKEHEEEK